MPHLEEAIKGILQAIEAAVDIRAKAALVENEDKVEQVAGDKEASHGQRQSPQGGTRAMS
jgi:hypothetical protein